MTTALTTWFWKVHDGRGNLHATMELPPDAEAVTLCRQGVKVGDAIGWGAAPDTLDCVDCYEVLVNWATEAHDGAGDGTERMGDMPTAKAGSKVASMAAARQAKATKAKPAAKRTTAKATKATAAKGATRTRAARPKDVPEGQRFCGKCSKVKPAQAFPISKSGPQAGKPVGWCKQCRTEYAKSKREAVSA